MGISKSTARAREGIYHKARNRQVLETSMEKRKGK